MMSNLCVVSVSVSILTGSIVCVAIYLENVVGKYYTELQDLREFKRNSYQSQQVVESNIDKMKKTIDDMQEKFNDCKTEVDELRLTSDNRVTTCPSYFSRYQNSCYMIYPYRMTWPEAYTFCQAVGAHLVYIEDKEEHDFLKGLASRTGHTAPQLWTGILEYMGGHIVFAGSGRKASYLDFKPGEPSSSPTDDCVALNKVIGYKMEDYNCAVNGNLFSLICEIELYHE